MMGARRSSLALLALPALCTALLSGCGNTLQDKPVPHNILEEMVTAGFPVYWLGDRFRTLSITEATRDPSGAFTVQYGNCLQGGQGICTPPLRVVSSPDNGFVPGGVRPSRDAAVRGVRVQVAEAGRMIAIPTGGVVVDIVAKDAALARAAAETIVAINRPDSPGRALPARQPDTGFGSKPLPPQLPATARPLG
jgi:hypothetical protein